jgi:hypothetical protein
MKIRGSMQVFSIIPEIAENVYLIVKEKLPLHYFSLKDLGF